MLLHFLSPPPPQQVPFPLGHMGMVFLFSVPPLPCDEKKERRQHSSNIDIAEFLQQILMLYSDQMLHYNFVVFNLSVWFQTLAGVHNARGMEA